MSSRPIRLAVAANIASAAIFASLIIYPVNVFELALQPTVTAPKLVLTPTSFNTPYWVPDVNVKKRALLLAYQFNGNSMTRWGAVDCTPANWPIKFVSNPCTAAD